MGWPVLRPVGAQSLVAPAPAATDWAAWASDRRRVGDVELAVWAAKRALAEWPGMDDDGVALHRQLAAWLATDGRGDEAQALQVRARSAALALFVDDAGDPASRLPQIEWTALERAWTRAWPAGPVGTEGLAERWARLSALPRPRDAPRPVTPRAAAGELRVSAVGAPQGLLLGIDDGIAVRETRIAWPQAQRERELGQALMALSRPGEPPPLALLQALYRRVGRVVDAAAQAARARTMVLQLDGPLRELPWAALHDGQAWLGERYALRQAVPGVTPARRAEGPLQMLALGTSQGDSQSQALPGVAAEVCAIVDGPVHGLGPEGCRDAPGGVVPGEAWLDDAFTSERLAQVLAQRPDARPGRSLLHLGTHFDLRPGRMARSTLRLGRGQRWPLSQVAGLDFSGQALVALAACETGNAGADVAASLQALVLQRGAGAVLATLWRVDDGSTAALMQSFYRELQHASPALALHRAQRQVRAHAAWRSPFHWAGYVLSSRS